MKNKFKDFLLYAGIFYVIIVVVMMVLSYCSAVSSIELSINSEHQKKMSEYKEKVNNLEESSCKKIMIDLIEKVDSDINREIINLKEYYKEINSDNSLLYYYPKVVEKCESITTEKMIEANMPVKFLTPSILGDEIVDKYIYQYELSTKDLKNREIRETNLIPVENNVRIFNEIDIIEKLLDIIDWEKEVLYED